MPRRHRGTLAAALLIAGGAAAGFFVSAVLFFWGLFAGVYAWYAISRSPAVLLWPRRAYGTDPSRAEFARAVNAASAGRATPIAVLDDSFPPPGAGTVHWLLAALPLAVLFLSLLSFFTGADSLHALLGSGESASPTTRALVFMLQAFAILLSGLYVLRITFRRQAVVDVPAADAETQAARLVARVRDRRGPVFGPIQVQAADRSWPGLIRRVMADADVTLFNVTVLDDELLQAIDLAYRRVPAERILLACAVDETDAAAHLQATAGPPATQELPDAQALRLDERLGSGVRQASPTLLFPRVAPGPGPAGGKTCRRLRREVQNAIDTALAAA